jgi:hypothetical protein
MGNYSGNYAKFHAAIRAELPASQTPNLFTLGAALTFLAPAAPSRFNDHDRQEGRVMKMKRLVGMGVMVMALVLSGTPSPRRT